MQINQEEQLGSEKDCTTQIPVWGNETSKRLTENTLGVEAAAGETHSLTGEVVGETHRVLECTQAHPPRNQHQKGPICLWVSGEVTESQPRAKEAALFPV